MDQDLRQYLDERFERVDDRLEQVDQRFERIENDIKAVRNDLRYQTGRLEIMWEATERDIQRVAEGHSRLDAKIDRRFDELHADFKETRDLLLKFSDGVHGRMGELDRRVTALEQRSRGARRTT